METLNNWFVWGVSIRGTLSTGKQVRTSWVVHRDGDVITTKSGSKYKLLDIAEYSSMTREEMYTHIDAMIEEAEGE